ncbi:MAG: tetratricopeptide repeat protein, partial [Cyanobacteria bacterium J06576_12]
ERELLTVQTWSEQLGREFAVFHQESAGALRVGISAPDQSGLLSGSYRLQVYPLEKAQIPLYQALSDAGSLAFRRDNEAHRLAVGSLEEALPLSFSDPTLSAEIHYRIGIRSYWLLNNEKALEHIRAAIEIWDQLSMGDAKAIGQAQLAATYIELGQFAEAASAFDEALTYQSEHGLLFDYATTLNHRGLMSLYRGELDAAIDDWEKSLAGFSQIGADYRMAQVIGNIAHVRSRQRRLGESIDLYARARALLEENRNLWLRSILLTNEASAQQRAGRLTAALLLLDEASSILDQIGDGSERSWVLANLASIYRAVGDRRRALALQERVVSMRRDGSEADALYRGLVSLGTDYRRIQTNDAIASAIEAHQEALDLAKTPTRLAYAHRELGRDYFAIGDTDRSIDQFNKAVLQADQANEELAKGLTRIAFATLASQYRYQFEQLIAEGATGLLSSDDPLVRSEAAYAMALVEPDVGRKIAYGELALNALADARLAVSNPWLATHLGRLEYPIIEHQLSLIWDEGAAYESQSFAFALAQQARSTALQQLLAESRLYRSEARIPGDEAAMRRPTSGQSWA